MQPGLRRMHKTAVSCALLLLSGCLIEVKNIICDTTEYQTSIENATSDAVPGKVTKDIIPTPAMIVSETYIHNSSNTDATFDAPTSDDNDSENNDSSVTSAIPLHTTLPGGADDQSNSSTQMNDTTLDAHSPTPSISSDGQTSFTTAEPETSSNATIVFTEKPHTPSNYKTLGIIISISFLIVVLFIILLCCVLRKKTKRYSFDLYHKSPEDANIPLSSVHEDNENGQISSEKKNNSSAMESSRTSSSEDATKAANAADSADK
ncbi:uncharacterized protein LOC115462700 [Microcaecilia unicolor]|uniref:Uncharacterized protein LOC115462700 n=1 Tax=Microcaecilia unicolor TaxID=1415580 RepID=A0A6P7XEE2_9AMPH|nr:uncharacterized protein LOC115462700 [Microcaecilia unicolor]